MTKLEILKANYEATIVMHDMEGRRRTLAAKSPIMVAYQNGEITADEYRELLAETYAETTKEKFVLDVETLKLQVKSRVKNGLLTAQEYEGITGEPYSGD